MSKSTLSCLISLLLIFILVVPGFGQTRVGKFGVGVDGSMQYILGAGTVKTTPAIGYGVNMSYSIMEGLGVRTNFTVNQLSWTNDNSGSVTTDLMSLNFYLSVDLMPNSPLNVFLLGGGGLAFYDPKDQSTGTRAQGISSSDIHYIGGLGADYFINEFWSVTLMGEYVLTGSPFYNGAQVNGGNQSFGNDSFLRGSIQVRYYFFDSAFITKLLNAQKDRSKRGK
jgi:hypothetical protein